MSRWELVRTYYVPFEDGIDLVSPVVARALALVAEHGRPSDRHGRRHRRDSAAGGSPRRYRGTCVGGEARVRTHTVLTRLAADNPGEYDGWVFADLSATLAAHGIHPGQVTRRHGHPRRRHHIRARRPRPLRRGRRRRGLGRGGIGEAGSSPRHLPAPNSPR